VPLGKGCAVLSFFPSIFLRTFKILQDLLLIQVFFTLGSSIFNNVRTGAPNLFSAQLQEFFLCEYGFV